MTPRSSDSTPDAGVVGRMIDKVKADGRWDRAYQRQATAQVPEDLQRALDAGPAAKAAFEALKSQPRYHILHQLMIARTANTRQIRIDRFIVQLQEQNAQDS
ncbi:UNVERIFIED_CONTAM: YdeI/OmpD-associated family protein [Actinomycetes bacterium ARC8]|nr:YdeI/OmpD-associated family protein [Actinomycetes bacterium ARC8]